LLPILQRTTPLRQLQALALPAQTLPPLLLLKLQLSLQKLLLALVTPRVKLEHL
jgi:hypothetical protein